jgi:hypothetical protein
MKLSILLIISSLFLSSFTSCKKKGCTDPLAENYSEKAKKDDGSCTFFELTGTISSPTTVEEGKTIKVCGDLYVQSTLTFSPGVTVLMCEGASITVDVNGSLSSVGTDQKPITIKGNTSTKGYWAQITFKSNNPNNKLVHTTVKDGGSYWYHLFSSVYVETGAQVTVTNSTINNSKEIGLYIDNGASLTSFSNNIFSNNGTFGLKISASNVQKLDIASNYNQSNGVNYIGVIDNTINNNHTWLATPVPYLLEQGLVINGNLTLNPNVKIKVEANQSIEIYSTGSMNASGTAANPISIEGKVATNGYWYGIFYSSNNTNNVLLHTTVKDAGGYWYYDFSTIGINNSARLSLDQSTITNSYSWGVQVFSGGNIYTNGSLQTTESGVTSNNSLSGNGANANANCTNGCAIKFE